MTATPTVVSRIKDRLTTDVALGWILTGGIYDRPLKREGAGSTPDAFATTPPYQPRPAAVVVDGTAEAMPLGPDGAFSAFPWVYLYAERHENGKAAIQAAFERMHAILHRWWFATAGGQGAEVMVVGRMAVMDDPENDKRVLGGMRLQVTSLWRVME